MLKIFNSPSFEPEIDAKTLHTLLEEIITPRLERRGFTKRGNYSWRNDTNQFRQGITYMKLKGAAGTFTWGVNIDFIPVVHSDKIQYYKTDKKFISHLWEGTDEYKNSFSGEEIKNGLASHLGFKKAKKTITNLFDRYEEKILKWLDKTKSIDELIDIAKQQIDHEDFYNIHSPRPKYILAFLYAKAKDIDKAVQIFESLDRYQFEHNDELREKVKGKLLMLTEEKNGT